MRGERMNPLWPLPENQVASENIAVVFDGGPTPIKYRARWYHYVAAFFWNLYRKPAVWKWKSEQNRIYEAIQSALRSEVLCYLIPRSEIGFYQTSHQCVECRKSFFLLRDQKFLSVIKVLLLNMRCNEHFAIYDHFLHSHRMEFERNEKLASWINGFV